MLEIEDVFDGVVLVFIVFFYPGNEARRGGIVRAVLCSMVWSEKLPCFTRPIIVCDLGGCGCDNE